MSLEQGKVLLMVEGMLRAIDDDCYYGDILCEKEGSLLAAPLAELEGKRVRVTVEEVDP